MRLIAPLSPPLVRLTFGLFTGTLALLSSGCGPERAPDAPKALSPAEPLPSPESLSSPEAQPSPESLSMEGLPSINDLRWPLAERATYGHPEPVEAWMGRSPEALAEKIRQSRTSMELDGFYRTLEALVIKGTGESRALAKAILGHLVPAADGLDIEAVLTPEGPRSEEDAVERWKAQRNAGKATSARSAVIRHAIRYQAYEYAMLYLLTGEQTYAQKAKAILLRTAEVLPKWPVYYEPSGESRAQDANDPAWFEKTLSGGVWGAWHPSDLAMSQPLLRAYDIVRPTLSDAEREEIETHLFLHHKKLMERFSAQLPYGNYPHYHNMLGYHLVALIRFGWVLDRPDFIHEVVEHWRKCLDYSYSPDGYFREISPAYHHQITSRMEQFIPSMLKGYSDPPGYHYPGMGARFDQLDLTAETARRFEQIARGRDVLAMPNGKYVSLNDDHANTTNPPLNNRPGARPEAPGLLGVSGVAKLATEGMVAFLKFGGMRGHDHYDALNLVWYAGDHEVMSETGYLPLAGTDATQEWIRNTASHNTVAVDETQHLQDRGVVTIPERHKYTSYNSYPPATPRHYAKTHRAEASLPGAAEFYNQGRLLLWDATRPQVQAMEAEQQNAYPRLTNLFRRTIVLVPLGTGEGYLVDIFRVRGGSTHDYFLRGGLDYPYTLSFTPELLPHKETLYSKLKVTGEAKVDQTLKAEIRYPDGLQTTSRLAAVSGSKPRRQSILAGTGPAIRRAGEAPFSLLRRSGNAPLESCFVWVHETHRGESRITSVEAFPNGMNVVVRINRTDGSDIVLSGLDEKSRFSFEGLAFQGRLAFASSHDHAAVFSGGPLSRRAQVIAPAAPSYAGKLLSTTQVEDGEAQDTALISLDTPSLREIDPASIRLAHFDMGSVIRFSIPVTHASKEGNDLRLVLAHPPGFHPEGGDTVMTRFPGWRVFSATSVSLDTTPLSPARP